MPEEKVCTTWPTNWLYVLNVGYCCRECYFRKLFLRGPSLSGTFLEGKGGPSR